VVIDNDGPGGTGAEGSAASGNGSGGVANAGATGSGADGDPGTGGEPAVPVDCSSVTGQGWPINESKWVPVECTGLGAQGSWFCLSDGVTGGDCANGAVPFRSGEGVCLSGETIVDPEYIAWGALI
jgi:hypothetical protein